MILIDHEYHIVELNYHLTIEVYDWLKEKFGPGDGNRWFARNKRIYFANSRDHLMFILAWGDK